MSYINKTSLLIPSQLPEFVRDNPDYATFVTFLQAYYEWMEQTNGVTYGSKNLPNYYDIDTTLDSFLQYYENDFLSFFPEGSLVDERKLIKVAKELYQSKGTPASYQFLFRVLYNSDVNLFNASDYILRASDGKWIVTKSLKLASIDPNWLQTNNRVGRGQYQMPWPTESELKSFSTVKVAKVDKDASKLQEIIDTSDDFEVEYQSDEDFIKELRDNGISV